MRAYQDPADSNTELGEFLRRISARGRLIVSRVKTRITKQYFRRGDFQIALADFRNLHPEHVRQVCSRTPCEMGMQTFIADMTPHDTM